MLLWCMDAYWYYSAFTLVMLIVFECTVVGQRRNTLNDMRAINVPKQHVEVCACSSWFACSMLRHPLPCVALYSVAWHGCTRCWFCQVA